MKRGLQGHFQKVNIPPEPFNSFIPAPLPPNPPVDYDVSLHDLSEFANRSLGSLNTIGVFLPDVSLFLYFYIRKEAVLSSQIEGTQSSLSDLLLYECKDSPGVPDDVVEVSNYVSAMDYGLRRLLEGLPLSSRLIREIHGVLLSKGRGSDKNPGEFRRSQNWLGGTRPGDAVFVPPFHEEVPGCISDLEKFLHDIEQRTPVLIKCALAHVQFETIHPFLDGNGRIGRLLIPLILCSEKVLAEPLLYLSLYFKTHRNRYYELLQSVRMDGDWESWIRFFLEGVRDTADRAVLAAKKILRLFEIDRDKIGAKGRVAGSVLQIYRFMQKNPLVSASVIVDQIKLSPATVNKALSNLEDLGIVREKSGRKRDRLFAYDEYLTILSEGTELLPKG